MNINQLRNRLSIGQGHDLLNTTSGLFSRRGLRVPRIVWSERNTIWITTQTEFLAQVQFDIDLVAFYKEGKSTKSIIHIAYQCDFDRLF